jgi:hypothetical protein
MSLEISEQYHAEGTQLPATPWLSIWIYPKRTIRFIVDSNPRMWVLPLAMTSGVTTLLNNAITDSWGDTLPILAIPAILIIAGPIFGLFSLYLGAGLIRWSGGILGGKATSEEVRAAIAWSSIPSIAAELLSIPMILIFGSESFTTETPRFETFVYSNPEIWIFLRYVLLGLALIAIVMRIWSIVISIRSLAEVHRFSSWRVIVAILIPAAILLVPLLCIYLAIL